jgi:hypothetical protein
MHVPDSKFPYIALCNQGREIDIVPWSRGHKRTGTTKQFGQGMADNVTKDCTMHLPNKLEASSKPTYATEILKTSVQIFF